MKVAIILGLVAFAISTMNCVNLSEIIKEEWNLFKIQFKKIYIDTQEELFRKKIYLDNKLKVVRHNKLYENGKETYAIEINHFSDMMQHEYNSMMNGFNNSLIGEKHYTNEEAVTFLKSENVVIPSSIDWREKGYVTPVKNQGSVCGSCWAFSATGSLEGQYFRKTGKLVSLSEQNLIDCTREYGNHGCKSGIQDRAFKYIKNNKGIDTEKSYPYEAKDDKCRFNPNNLGATVKGYVDIPRGDENALMHALSTVGPISISVDSSGNFKSYKTGVYYNPLCRSTRMAHALLVVGFGTDKKNGDYWIVKNSWGENWGEKGYILMARNKTNNCGIASSASCPLVY